MCVLRVLLTSRYPRTAPAIAASAGVSRATGYRALLRLVLGSGLPIAREGMRDGTGGTPTTLWGIDWAALRRMG